MIEPEEIEAVRNELRDAGHSAEPCDAVDEIRRRRGEVGGMTKATVRRPAKAAAKAPAKAAAKRPAK